MLDDALVLRRAAGLRAGVGDERAVLRDARVLLEADRVLVERARREVVVDLGDGEAVGGEIEGGGCRAHGLVRVFDWQNERSRGSAGYRTKVLLAAQLMRDHDDAP